MRAKGYLIQVPFRQGEKLLNHQIAGQLRFEHLTFLTTDSVDLQVTINIPKDNLTEEKLKGLLAHANTNDL